MAWKDPAAKARYDRWYRQHIDQIRERKRKLMGYYRAKAAHPCVDCGEPCHQRALRCRRCADKARVGSHLSSETKQRLSTIFKEQYRSGERKPAAANRGKPAPYAAGPNSHFWKGGHDGGRGVGFYAVKTRIRDLVGKRCEVCGSTEQLAFHHIIRFKWGGDNSDGNIIQVCRSCHSGLENELSHIGYPKHYALLGNPRVAPGVRKLFGEHWERKRPKLLG